MKKYLLPSIAALFLIAVYYLYNPSDSALFPKCPFFILTGLKCPGCGSQRAIHSLLNLDITGAVHHNALLVVSIPAIILYTYAEIHRKDKPVFYSMIHNHIMIWGLTAVIILWWMLRNIFDI